MRRLSVVTVVTLVLATALVPVGAVGGASDTQFGVSGVDPSAAPPPVPAAAEQPAVDDTVTRIEVAANGTAVWELAYQTRLQTDAEVDDYRTFQSEFRNDTATFEATFRERIGAVVADATNETGREMAVTNVTATTAIRQVPRRIGVVTYRFRWTGFAETDGDRVVAGDVFEGGYYLADNDSLVVSAPSGYVVERATPTPSVSGERQVRWTGRLSFADGRPLVVARPADTSTATATQTRTQTPATVTTGPATAGGDGEGGLPWLPVGAVALILAAVVALAVRGDGPFGDGGPFGGGAPSDATPPDGGASADDGAPPDDGTPAGGGSGAGTDGADAAGDTSTTGTSGESDAAAAGDAGGATSSGGATGGTAAGDATSEASAGEEKGGDTERRADEEPTAADAATADAIAEHDETDDSGSSTGADDDGELPEPYASVLDGIRPPLTDAERVERALARERGRMRQSALADELDWSASKTSRVLSDMESDERIEKIRVGRENVVDLVVDEGDGTG